eukprot:gene10813-19622_t
MLNNRNRKNDELRIYNAIIKGYETDIHPSDPVFSTKVVKVTLDVQLIRILEINERDQFVKLYVWVNQYWTNPLLRWDPKEYGNVTTLFVNPAKVWVPDIVLYNSIDENGEFSGGLETYKHKVQVNYDGKNSWLNPAIFRSICPMDVRFFPFDDQVCKLKFGSWAHDASMIDIEDPPNSTSANDYYINHGEWELLGLTAKRNAKKYQCCANPFVDMTLTVSVRRHAISYELTLIIPCALLSSLVYLGFILPPESGERIGLSITVLLAVTVFQEMTSQLMPRFDFPFLAQYYLATIFQTAFSLVVTTVILNFYHRSNREMPWLVRLILLKWMYPVLFCASKRFEKEADPVDAHDDQTERAIVPLSDKNDPFQAPNQDQNDNLKTPHQPDILTTDVIIPREKSIESKLSAINDDILITVTDCEQQNLLGKEEEVIQANFSKKQTTTNDERSFRGANMKRISAKFSNASEDELNSLIHESTSCLEINTEPTKAKKKMSTASRISQTNPSIRKRLSRSGETHFAIGKAINSSAFMLLGDSLRAQGTAIYKKQEKKKREEILAERKRDWVKAARVLDRFFLILFIITSTCLLVLIFCRAPRFSR